jgi:hypothetical protein
MKTTNDIIKLMEKGKVITTIMQKIWADTAHLKGDERKQAYAQVLCSTLRYSVSNSQRIHQPALQ